MQTKKQSIIEIITSTFIGFVISLLATFIIFPMVNVASTPSKNVAITVFFTIISILRGYFLHRLFNKKQTKPIEQLVLEAKLKVLLERVKILEDHRFNK